MVDHSTGSTTIFHDDIRIATNVRLRNGDRAVGSRAASDVSETVLRRGEVWRGRTLVGNQWFISEYDPIRDYSGKVIGMLSVGLPEDIYTEIRNQVIFSFFAHSTACALSTLAPCSANSCISSYEISSSRLASGTTRGSAE